MINCECANCGYTGPDYAKKTIDSWLFRDWKPSCINCGGELSMTVTADDVHCLPPSSQQDAMSAFSGEN